MKAREENGDADSGASFRGIFHFSCAERFTKYEMVMAMADKLGMDASHVVADQSAAKSTTTAKRPHDARLSCAGFERLGITTNSNFREEIKAVLEPHL